MKEISVTRQKEVIFMADLLNMKSFEEHNQVRTIMSNDHQILFSE